MRRAGSNRALASALAALALLAGCGGAASAPDAPAEAGGVGPVRIGLLTSLPLYWPETDSPADLLKHDAPIQWPRALIEQRHELVPLDALDGEGGLAQVPAALLAQPRPLSAAENVALDDWVRAGGHVLVFADPALTMESQFHLGDRRRPQDVILLSPILKRWGLTLSFDEGGRTGEYNAQDSAAGALPVHLPGVLAVDPAAGDSAGACRIDAGGVVARCRIGRGSATIVADAALFEDAAEARANVRTAALSALIDSLARAAALPPGMARESAGKAGAAAGGAVQTGPPERGERD